MENSCINIELDFQEYIETLINREESYDLEFKKATGGFPKSFWETYSAFANTQGGVVVLGVEERGNRFYIQGLTDEQINEYQKLFWRNVNNRQLVSTNLLSNSDVLTGEYEGCKLLCIYVPRADRTLRPVYLSGNPMNAYKRNHEGDNRLTEAETKRMMADADVNISSDSRILNGYSMDDIDVQSLRQYRNLFNVSHYLHPWAKLDDKEFLDMLGGYRKDRITGKEGFTVAGILMFGKDLSIKDPECVPSYFVDYRAYAQSHSGERWTDRIFPDGTWAANLFQFFYRTYSKLVDQLPVPFRLEGGLRKDETPTHVALREALANSLVHADFAEVGGIVIEQRPEEYLFANPGKMLISKAQYYKGGITVGRNSILQKMFLLMGMVEQAGSGVNKIFTGWDEANRAFPYVEETDRPDRTILHLPKLCLLESTIVEGLESLFGDSIKQLDKNALWALAICYTEQEISNESLQYRIKLHRSDITKLLKELCNKDFLCSQGNGRGTTYHLNGTSSTENMGSYGTSSTENRDSYGTSSEKNMDSYGTSSEKNMDSSIPNMDSSKLRNYAKREELEKHIVDICINYHTIDEIAIETGRTSKYLKNFIIPVMLEKNLLERKFENPKHPAQKYKAKLSEREE